MFNNIQEKSSTPNCDLNIKFKHLRMNTKGKTSDKNLLNNNIEINNKKK